MLTYLALFHLYLTLCLIFYYFMLRKEPTFKYNRIFLISVLIISALLPTIPLHMFSLETADLTYQIYLPMVQIGPEQFVPSSVEHKMWISLQSILLGVYALGVATQAGRLLWGMVRMHALKRDGRIKLKDGIAIVNHPSVVIPFSYLDTVYLPEHLHLDSPEARVIVRHEMAHIALGHSLDVWLCQLFKMVLWWSPLSYIYEYFLREIHEYQADYTAIKDTDLTPAAYSTLLVDYCSANPSYPFVNAFNYSPIKSRIMMLFQKQSNPKVSIFKYTMVVPLLTGLLFFQGFTKKGIAQKKREEPYSISLRDTIITFDTDTYEESMRVVKREIKDIYKMPDIMPSLLDEQGNPLKVEAFEAKLLKFVNSNLKYPPEAKKAGLEGVVVASLIIDTKGDLTYFKVVRSPDLKFTESVEEMLFKMQSEENGLKWSPGMVDGEPVNTRYLLPVKFKLN